jgi:hypothetical protein
VGHPNVDNSTPYAFEPVFVADEDLRPVVIMIVKATFDFGLDGAVRLAEDQVAVNFSGERWTDTPTSSYRYEPETALTKPTTDVVLIGHSRAPGGGMTEIDVGIRVGPVQRVARVFGDRYWVMTNGSVRCSRAAPLGRVPLTWENSFGGTDETASTPECTICEARNPIGTGFGTPLMRNGDRLRLPNIEDPKQLISEYGAVVAPCGFGFTSPHWEPRATLAGTYDESWDKTRKPLLPSDFSRQFFNAAAPGLIAPAYLRGDEEVWLLNTTAVPRLFLRLPAVPPPVCRLILRGQPDTLLTTNLDTVVVDGDSQQLLVLWRAYAYTQNGPHDVSAIAVDEVN